MPTIAHGVDGKVVEDLYPARLTGKKTRNGVNKTMNPDQINQLLALLSKIAERPYTITGAADWPILVAICSLLFALIGFMWLDLKNSIKERKDENERDHDKIWNALRDCKEDCCPARRKP